MPVRGRNDIRRRPSRDHRNPPYSVLASSMGLDATGRRRIIGAVFLLIALGMLIAGQTVFKASLSNLGFLVYWALCFVFTGLAIVVAFRDAHALRQRTRREARDLIENTLGRIEEDRKKFPPRSGDKDRD